MFSSVERVGSVSSMRRMNVPPFCAGEKAQFIDSGASAPMCSLPVGEGAKRTRTSDAMDISSIAGWMSNRTSIKHQSNLRKKGTDLLIGDRLKWPVVGDVLSLRLVIYVCPQ